MTCEQAEELLLPYVEDECALDEREAITVHLSGCASCQEKAQACRDTIGRLGVTPAPSGFKDRLFKRLEEEKLLPSTSRSGEADVIPLAARTARRGWGRPYVTWAASIAAVLVVGVLLGELLRPGEDFIQGMGFFGRGQSPAPISPMQTFKAPLPVAISAELPQSLQLGQPSPMRLRLVSSEAIDGVIVTVMVPDGLQVRFHELDYGHGQLLHVSVDLKPQKSQELELQLIGQKLGEVTAGLQLQKGIAGVSSSFSVSIGK